MHDLERSAVIPSLLFEPPFNDGYNIGVEVSVED